MSDKLDELLGELALKLKATGDQDVKKVLDTTRKEVENTATATSGWLGRLQGGFMAFQATALATFGVVAGGLATMSYLAEDERAGAGLRVAAAELNSLLDTMKVIGLEAAEILAQAFDIGPNLGRFRDMVYSIWENWRGTFLSAADLAYEFYLRVAEIFNAVTSAIGLTTESGGESWASMLRYWLDLGIFFLRSWRSILDLVGEQFRVTFDDAKQFAAAFVVNLGVLAHNIYLFFYDIYNFIAHFLRNVGLNIRNFLEAVERWFSGGGWRFDTVNLMAGFRSSLMRDMLSFVAPEYDNRGQRDRLADAVGQQWADFVAEREQRQREILADLVRPRQEQPQPPAQVTQQPAQQFGLVGFSELARRSQEDTLRRLAERQADATERAAVGIEALAEAARGPGLRIQGSTARYE